MRLVHVDHFVGNLYAPFPEDTFSVAKLFQDIEMKRNGYPQFRALDCELIAFLFNYISQENRSHDSHSQSSSVLRNIVGSSMPSYPLADCPSRGGILSQTENLNRAPRRRG